MSEASSGNEYAGSAAMLAVLLAVLLAVALVAALGGLPSGTGAVFTAARAAGFSAPARAIDVSQLIALEITHCTFPLCCYVTVPQFWYLHSAAPAPTSPHSATATKNQIKSKC